MRTNVKHSPNAFLPEFKILFFTRPCAPEIQMPAMPDPHDLNQHEKTVYEKCVWKYHNEMNDFV